MEVILNLISMEKINVNGQVYQRQNCQKEALCHYKRFNETGTSAQSVFSVS